MSGNADIWARGSLPQSHGAAAGENPAVAADH